MNHSGTGFCSIENSGNISSQVGFETLEKKPAIKKMKQRIAYISLVVKDYDEAIEFYTKKLDFNLIEDTKLSDQKRWVIVAPPGSSGCSLLLAS